MRWTLQLSVGAVVVLAGACARVDPQVDAGAGLQPSGTGGTELYVSPTGRDTWSGQLRAPNSGAKDGPLATLQGARDVLRRLRAAGKLTGSVTVTVAPGTYPLTETLAFDASDSGTPENPVIYRAAEPGTVRVSGGQTIRAFAPVSDAAVCDRLPAAARGNVLAADLRALGITDYGQIANSGFGWKTPLSHMELFFDGRPMRLAQWPNGEWTTIATVPKGERIVDNGGKKRGVRTDRFGYSGDRPTRWASFDDVWVHGYWFVDWADQYLKVKTVDTDARMVVIDPPQGPYGYKKGQRFRFLNVLEELDEPGEWYLDRKTGKLYVWPPADATTREATVSLLSAPLVTFNGVSDLQLVGLTFEAGRSDGIRVNGGARVLIAGCELRNLGGMGIKVSNGTGHRVQSCNVHGLAEGGITMTGGDRRTLTPAGHAADNNHVHHFSRWVRTYRAGIRISGVGNSATHNYIHDAPHSGITYSGNNHLFEFNELARLCLDTGDVGGTYTGRDWTARGTILRHNYLHDLGGMGFGSNAFYLDDLACGQKVIGNICHNVWRGVMIGGGRDNVVENNIFVNFRIGVHFDARGIGWSRPLIEGGKSGWDMYGRLKRMPYTKPPYSEQYPELPGIMQDCPLEPRRNRVVRNIFVGKKWLDCRRFKKEEAEAKNWSSFEGNYVGDAPGFVDAANGDFRLKLDSPALALGFKQIPVDKIGLRVDAYRAQLPVR